MGQKLLGLSGSATKLEIHTSPSDKDTGGRYASFYVRAIQMAGGTYYIGDPADLLDMRFDPYCDPLEPVVATERNPFAICIEVYAEDGDGGSAVTMQGPGFNCHFQREVVQAPPEGIPYENADEDGNETFSGSCERDPKAGTHRKDSERQ